MSVISVRVDGGQVLAVPEMRLNWGEEYPQLIALMERVKVELIQGLGETTVLGQLALGAEFVREVAKVAKYPDSVDELVRGCRGRDVVVIHAALRGVESANPTDG